MLRNFSLIAVALVVSLVARLSASADSIPAEKPAASTSIDSLVQKLGDASFAVRQQAQKQLEQIPLSQRDAVAAIAEKTTDEEIKIRLTQLIDLMDNRLATEPPPISLDIRDASLIDVANALGKATGTTIGTLRPMSNSTYTLKAADQPFWDVIRQLSNQEPLSFAPPATPTDIPRLWSRGIAHMQIQGGVALMTHGATLNPESKITLPLAVALDPRIDVIDFHAMQIIGVRDDQNHLLNPVSESAPMGPAARIAAIRGTTTAQPRFFQSRDLYFDAPKSLGKTVTVKGSVGIFVQLARATAQIADANKHLNEPVVIGDSAITLRNYISGDPEAATKIVGISLQIVPKDSAVPPPEPPAMKITANGISLSGFGSVAGTRMVIDHESTPGGIFMGAAATGEMTTILVTDAKNKVVANYRLPRGLPITSVHTVNADFQEPLKFTLTYPTKTREVVIPFEFKDIPIQR